MKEVQQELGTIWVVDTLYKIFRNDINKCSLFETKKTCEINNIS